MPRLEKSHRVSHSANDMFDLVCDVEHYPEFVPLCKSLAVKSSKERNDKSLIVADMTMAYQMLSETFTTQVLMDRSALKIDVKYIDGPFKRLENVWSFKEVDTTSCDVNFMIDYELRSKLLAAAAGAIFDRAFAKFVDAFETRANEVYGKA